MADLEIAIKAAPTRASHRRMQAIKAVLLGGSHEFVSELYNTTRQTLIIWIKAFNAQDVLRTLGPRIQRPAPPA